MKIDVTDFGTDVRLSLSAEGEAERCQLSVLMEALTKARTNFGEWHALNGQRGICLAVEKLPEAKKGEDE
jgi:hypothetical protein